MPAEPARGQAHADQMPGRGQARRLQPPAVGVGHLQRQPQQRGIGIDAGAAHQGKGMAIGAEKKMLAIVEFAGDLRMAAGDAARAAAEHRRGFEHMDHAAGLRQFERGGHAGPAAADDAHRAVCAHQAHRIRSACSICSTHSAHSAHSAHSVDRAAGLRRHCVGRGGAFCHRGAQRLRIHVFHAIHSLRMGVSEMRWFNTWKPLASISSSRAW